MRFEGAIRHMHASLPSPPTPPRLSLSLSLSTSFCVSLSLSLCLSLPVSISLHLCLSLSLALSTSVSVFISIISAQHEKTIQTTALLGDGFPRGPLCAETRGLCVTHSPFKLSAHRCVPWCRKGFLFPVPEFSHVHNHRGPFPSSVSSKILLF